MSILLEVCIDSIASAIAAKDGGADRLEVCSALAIGGTTPSFGLVEQCVADLQMPVVMMIRPHDGGFIYENDDVETMLTDIEVAKSIGVQGIVFGALTNQRTLDENVCEQLIEAADDLEITFHRAFDVVIDPLDALDRLESLGVTRILTSGQQATASAGTQLIQSLTERSKKLKVLAGAGINAENACQLVQETGVQELHASASVLTPETQDQGNVSFGAQRRVTCRHKVRAIKDAVSKL